MSDKEFTGRMVETVLTVAAVAIVLAAMWAAREALMLIYVSAIIAMGFSPLVRMIERPQNSRSERRVRRTLAILMIYLTIVALVVLMFLLVVPPLIEQAGDLWAPAARRSKNREHLLVRRQPSQR